MGRVAQTCYLSTMARLRQGDYKFKDSLGTDRYHLHKEKRSLSFQCSERSTSMNRKGHMTPQSWSLCANNLRTRLMKTLVEKLLHALLCSHSCGLLT